MSKKLTRTEPLIQLTYREATDGMLYPNIQISANKPLKEVKNYGLVWKEYMMEYHPHRLWSLIAEGRINHVILSMDEEAEEAKEKLIKELLIAQPMPETGDILERAAHMYMITSTAEEIIISEVVLKVR